MDLQTKKSSVIFAQLLREAQRATRHRPEAEDLFQTIWIAAAEAGRQDLSSPSNRRWFVGALRKRALFEARSAIRRRSRERSCVSAEAALGRDDEAAVRFVKGLPPKLRTTALLILSGHDKRELLWLLRMKEPALRQRIADVRRRWRAEGGVPVGAVSGLRGTLDFGTIRRALLGPARAPGVLLASHDPDGHLFVVSISRKPQARQPASDLND